MNLKNYLFRLAAILTAFMLGVGFFNAAQYQPSIFQTPETAEAQPLVKQETVFVPPRPVPTVIFAAPETVADSKEETEAELDAGDEYYIIGDLPKGFKDFDILDITTRNYENLNAENDYQGTPIPPEGYVLTKKKFKLVRINIANRQITFETEAKDGISYKFVGKFIDEEPIIGVYTSYAVLEGRLVKMRAGKKVAESEVKLGRVGGC